MSGYNCDPHALALDYRYVGFRECAAEVARYLVAVEGMDLQDPLRMRLLSHLQCYSAQREAAAKASLQASATAPAWPPAPPTMPPVPAFNTQYGSMGHSSQQTGNDVMTSQSTSSSSVLNAFTDTRYTTLGGDGSGVVGGGSMSLGGGVGVGVGGLGGSLGVGGLNTHTAGRGPAAAMTASASSSSSSALTGHQSSMSPPLLHSLPYHATQFPPQHSAMLPSSHAYSHSQGGLGQHSASVKPYRPWGGELAY